MLAVLQRLHGSGFEFLALVPGAGPLSDSLHAIGIETIEFSLRDELGTRLPRESALQGLGQHVARVVPDILHANSLSMGRLTGALGAKFSCCRVAHVRDILRVSQAVVRDLNQNDRLIAVSQATADAHIGQGFAANRITVLRNGVDCERFAPRPRTGRLADELDSRRASSVLWGGSRFLALSVGQIGLRKGLDTLAEAAALLGPSAEIDFVMVGERYSQKDESIEFERQISRVFEDAGMKGQLHRLGYREDIPWLMNESDILVHAAKQEPFGRVLLEAAASGLPIVATDVGGTREMLGNAAAVLIPPHDPQAMANAIDGLRNDESRRSWLATTARQRILERFRIEFVADRMAELWDLESRRRTGS